eukprot:CAMPEP_0171208098 /NCGR_PEP_ID=MMETSP0790-20130122/27915_1 /TAXON_ID=2925 /ORGANISM="Alexandrium catenella, Strain OF101" /LENGTH=35 /DNA_ID= /DNA_START= /DNA_END= /DNA_ORIENTATION=
MPSALIQVASDRRIPDGGKGGAMPPCVRAGFAGKC